MNTLHISSTNTVGEVIEALLKKFLVAESPAKFALYKRCHREDQGIGRACDGSGLCFCLSFVLVSRRQASGRMIAGSYSGAGTDSESRGDRDMNLMPPGCPSI